MAIILFSLSIHQHVQELVPAMRHFSEHGHDVHVLMGFRDWKTDEFRRVFESLGFAIHLAPRRFSYVELTPPPPRQAATPSLGAPRIFHHIWQSAKRFGRSFTLLPSIIMETALIARHCRKLLAWTECFFNSIEPEMVFSGPYSSCGRLDDAVEAVCRKRRTPYFCITYSYLGGKYVKINSRFERLRKGQLSSRFLAERTIAGRILARLFPIWVAEMDAILLFPHDPVRMLGTRLGGLLQEDPWMDPSLGFDLVFVFSEYTKKLITDSGYPEDKVIVSGQPLLDEVMDRLDAESYRRELCADTGIEWGKPFVLVNIEPGKEHGYASSERHWANFHDLMDSLSVLRLEKVLSLHPLCNPEEYLAFEKQYGCRIARNHRISQLYPLADFVVSMPCSTNYLSALFGKRLIIYDFYNVTKKHESRPNFFRLPGALIAKSRQELDGIIWNLASGGPSVEGSAAPPSWRAKAKAVDIIYECSMSRLS